jgi:hypothetical protein
VKKLLFFLFLTPGILVADVVLLKGGGRLSGRITEQTADKVLVDVGDGILGVSMDRVEKIEKGPTPLDDFDGRAAKVGPKDVNGWRDLALWASSKGLLNQSRAAYQRVLAIAPDDPEARRALGFVQVDGRWLTEEDSYRARGFVKVDGEWMTPAEVQVAQATATIEQAKDDAAKRASDAEFAANMDRLRKQEEAKRAQETQDRMRNDPVSWSAWGYGVAYWPSTGLSQPAMVPAGAPQ